MTEEERAYRYNIDIENWALCQEAYRQNNAPTMSQHTHRKHRKHRPNEVKDDLQINNCRTILGKYWASY